MGTKGIIEVEELKRIQLDILCYFDKFCRDNSINYSLACGTLLGAVRHKGYIPWDDDIDIYMLRDDYVKFVDLFLGSDNDPYKLNCFPHNKNIDRVYANLYDSRTVMIEGKAQSYELGVFIDIFPLDDVPDEQKDWNRFKKKLFFVSWLRNVKVFEWSTPRGLLKNLSLYVSKFILFPFSLNSVLSYMNSFIQKNNGKGYNHVYQTSYGVENDETLIKEMFYDLVDYEFEGHKFKGVHDADAYLTTLYGNYMQLPPEENRVAHHLFKAWWK